MTTVRVAVVEADALGAVAAADLLTMAWPLPALRYTPQYLAWQLTFPGGDGVSPLAVAAVELDRWVGFAAGTPRRVMIGGAARWIHLVSFVAVHPDRQGQGIASRLYRVLLDNLKQQPTAGVVTFAQPESGGEVALVKAYQEAGYARFDLGEYQPLGLVLRGPQGGEQPLTPEDSSDEPPALPGLDGHALVVNAPDENTWRHYRSDPRGARWIAVAEAPEVGFLLVKAERLSPRGVEPFLMIANTFGGPFDAAALRALVGRVQAAGQGLRTASWPNSLGIGADDARAAGLRAFPGSYRGFLFLRETVPDGLSGYTNLEVV